MMETILANITKSPSLMSIICMIALALFYERKAIIAWLRKRQESQEEREDRFWEEEVGDTTYARSMVERTLATMEAQQEAYQNLLTSEKTERKAKNGLILDQTRATQEMTTAAVEVMKDFADVARLQSNHMGDIASVLENVKEILSGVGFVLARLYFKDEGMTFSDLIVTMKTQEEEHG